MTNLYEVLKASRIPSSAPDAYTALWAKNLTGGGYTPTEHQYTGEVPTVIIANGEPLISCLIYGNMSQSGTPSPTTPIQPSECGEKTGNLFDENAKSSTKGYLQNYYLSGNGTEIPFTDPNNKMTWDTSEYIPVESNTSYYYTDNVSHVSPCICEYDANHNYISSHSFNNTTYISFTTSANTKYVRLSIFDRIDQTTVHMLNLGSEPLPYEPYGYKIPILSANTTTPVYLGEVQSTRQIKKLVLTGNEANWGTEANMFTLAIDMPMTSYADYICSHYNAVFSYDNCNQNNNTMAISKRPVLFIHDNTYSTIADFKTYLAQQYAAGTPVTIWYVLATPTTGIVNEPIRKIGEYADEVSVSDVPTVEGSQTFDVETNLKPSSVDITYIG